MSHEHSRHTSGHRVMALILIGNMISDACIKLNAYLHVFLTHVAPSVVPSIRSRGAGLEFIEILPGLRVASVRCGPGPCTDCPQNTQSRFGMSCSAALRFSSQDHLA